MKPGRLILFLASMLKGSVWYARRLGVTVGEDCRIYIRSWGSEPFLIRIGDHVTVTSGVRFLTHDGATWLVRDNGRRYFRYGPISVGDNVFVGVNSVLMPGVNIGSNAVIAAGSVVTRDVPSGSVVAGCPARPISTFEKYSEKVRRTCANETEIAGAYQDRVNRALEIQRARSL